MNRKYLGVKKLITSGGGGPLCSNMIAVVLTTCHFFMSEDSVLVIETQFEPTLAKGEPCRAACVQRQTRTRVDGEPRKATVFSFPLLFM